jgi:predicted ABC-type transport system involved in lysophospholipase L1 biosynthesis ATPase subunit
VITHDAEVAAAMRRQVRLRDGRIIADSGTPS